MTVFKGVPAGCSTASPASRSLSSGLLQRRLDPPSTRGSPWQNASIQSVNGRPRDDLLNGQRFDIVVFLLPWRAAAVPVRRVAVA